MKIFFPEYRFGGVLHRQPLALRTISPMVIGFFAGICGSYLLSHHLGFLAHVSLGIGGSLAGAVLSTFLTGNDINGPRKSPKKRQAPQVKSAWDYRPRRTTRHYAAGGCATAVTSTVAIPQSSTINQETDLWYNFVAVDPTIQNVVPQASVLERRHAIPAYDQSPIDDQAAVAHHAV